jgi:hypothetical protein
MNRLGIFLAGVTIAHAGCLGKDQTTRSQLDDGGDKPAVHTVGDASEFQTTGAIPVSGIGLVVGLDGTGGGAPPGAYRQMAEEYLKRNKIENPKEWLDHPNNALVLVSAEVPAGSRRGDRINVEVTLPPGSKAKSLRGGYLLETPLSSYSSLSQVRSQLEQNDFKTVSTGDGLLKGHTLADAEGPLNVPVKDRGDGERVDDVPDGSVKRAFVWKGGRAKIDQPFFLVMNPSGLTYRKTMLATERINETFHGPGAPDKVAVSRSKETIVLSVPPQYRSNLPHFLRVVRMIPEQHAEPGSDYRRRLEEQLLQPETTLSAALRLEALGRESIPVLTAAMKDGAYPLVRFAAAEALAYLGEPVCAGELAKLAATHPSLQAYCLAALGSLDEAASSLALQDLLAEEAPEVRYGAFRALREADPRGADSRGRRMNKSFWLHEVAPKSKPLVHLLGSGRAEIVLFGEKPALVAPFSLRVGPDVVLTAKAGDESVTVGRFSTRRPQRQELCSFALADVIKTLADLGAQYDDVARMLLEARDTKALNCDLAVDALPRGVPVQKLAENAHVDKTLQNEADLLKGAASDRPENVFDRAAMRK